jgi:hypothetical protein
MLPDIWRHCALLSSHTGAALAALASCNHGALAHQPNHWKPLQTIVVTNVQTVQAPTTTNTVQDSASTADLQLPGSQPIGQNHHEANQHQRSGLAPPNEGIRCFEKLCNPSHKPL